MANNNVPAEGVKISGQDKRARLALITHLIQQGKVMFPRRGTEELIQQLTGFSIEKYDDLADAFSLLLLKVLDLDNEPEPGIMFIEMGSSIYDYKRSGLSDDVLKPFSMDMEF